MGNRDDQGTLPPGTPPWDTWNGARVGLITGGLIGVLAVWVSGSDVFWMALPAAAVGALVGYRAELRKRRAPRDR